MKGITMAKKLGNNPLKGIDSIVCDTQSATEIQFISLPHKKQNIETSTIDTSEDSNMDDLLVDNNIQSTHSLSNQKSLKNKELPKMSLALQPEAMTYVQLMSGIKTTSMTQYINQLIFEDMKRNAALYTELKKLIQS
jgi:hypothetical protein